jgi:hypothetical protein
VTPSTDREHFTRSGQTFLVRLEHQLDRPGQRLLSVSEQPGGTEQHSGMQIVSAGVCRTGARGIRKTALFPHGQSVHIRAQQHGPTRQSPDNRCNQTTRTAFNRRQSDLYKAVRHISCGPGETVTHFWKPVEAAAVGYQLPADAVCSLQIFLRHPSCAGSLTG